MLTDDQDETPGAASRAGMRRIRKPVDVKDTVVARGGSRRVRVARAAWRESSGVVHDTLSRAAARRGGNPQEHFKRQCRSAPALIRLNPRPRSTSSLGRATARAVL